MGRRDVQLIQHSTHILSKLTTVEVRTIGFPTFTMAAHVHGYDAKTPR